MQSLAIENVLRLPRVGLFNSLLMRRLRDSTVGMSAVAAAIFAVMASDLMTRAALLLLALLLTAAAGYARGRVRGDLLLQYLESEFSPDAEATDLSVPAGLPQKLLDVLANLRALRDQHKALAALACKSSRQIANTATKLSLSAERLTEASADLNSASAASSEEISRFVATLRGIEEQAQTANQLSEQTHAQGVEGQQLLEATAKDVSRVVNSLHDSSRTITDLNNRTRQLDGIIVRITDIAKETNLLSLNAAIEAARSGEAGRGFAVVADNVRNLADQSRDAARHVSEVLVAVRKEAQKAQKFMQAAVQDIDGINAGTGKADASMRDISARAATASKAFAQILDAISNQSRAADRITEQLATVAERSERNQEQARTTLDAVQRLETLGQTLYASASGESQNTSDQ